MVNSFMDEMSKGYFHQNVHQANNGSKIFPRNAVHKLVNVIFHFGYSVSTPLTILFIVFATLKADTGFSK